MMGQTEFERDTSEKLGRLLGGMETLTGQVDELFTTIKGNGHPGLIQRMALVEQTLAERKESSAAKIAFVSGITSSLVIGAIELLIHFLPVKP